ncbi:hypothetical protein BDN72DRAFT_843560 [Pluteus cervinus]|uniref:Uncharacterized protein n=1 Tax=Pluteus cervinus TaxID=181527 RepID=A0ACD3AMJ8_9AGAR|nr:hypothetical protein BDN72DRAFT_843560 [Pluteus cervinus]
MHSEDNPLPIHTVPVELLAEVFLKAAKSSYKRQQMTLILTWVCRRWREIALNTPQLWNHIDSIDIEFIFECISRSKEMPLTVETFAMEPGCPPHIPAVLQCLPKIQKLVIYGDDEGGLTSVTDKWTTPAPILESLDVSFFYLPSALFSGVAPPLRNLSLDCCFFTLTAFPPLSELRTLSLSHAQRNISAYDLLERLGELPRITSLELLDAIADDGPRVPDRVNLPRLRKLSIRSELFSCTLALFEQLTLPALSDFYLNIEVDVPDNHIRMLQALQQCRRPPTIAPSSLHIVVAQTFQEYTIREAGDDHQTAVIRLRFTCDTTIAMVESTCQSLSLHNLEELVVDDADPTTDHSEDFWNMFGALPKLHTVKVSGSFAPTFVHHFFQIHDVFLTSLPQSSSDQLYEAMRRHATDTLQYMALESLVFTYASRSLKDYIQFFIPGLDVRRMINMALKEMTVIGSVALDDNVMENLKKSVLTVNHQYIEQNQSRV